MKAWGRAIVSAMQGFHNEADSGLVRLFRIEYAKEYNHLRRMGQHIDDRFVREFLTSRKG